MTKRCSHWPGRRFLCLALFSLGYVLLYFVHHHYKGFTTENSSLPRIHKTSFEEYLLTFSSVDIPGDLSRLQYSVDLDASVPVLLSKKVDCPRKLKAGSSKLPFTALVSFPGSGNTWTRHIVQQLTGLPTGSLYQDDRLKENSFPFQGKLKNVIAVKTHGIPRCTPKPKPYVPLHKFDRILVVVRNVYKAFVAAHKFLTIGHTANGIIDVNGTDWHKNMAYFPDWWESFMTEILRFPGPRLIVFYENLIAEPLKQMIRIADFLSTDEVKEFSFGCALDQIEGNFHRQPVNQTIFDVFDTKLRMIINEKIKKVAKHFPVGDKTEVNMILSYQLPIS